jgi:hypothetical protein
VWEDSPAKINSLGHTFRAVVGVVDVVSVVNPGREGQE